MASPVGPVLPPPLPAPTPSSPSSATVVLLILMWLAWIGVVVVADFFAFLMFAFADSPGAGAAAQKMIAPIFLWFGFTFLAGIALLIFRGWWQVPLAFVLAASPPFLVFLGYNLLMGSGASTGSGGGSSGTSMSATPAPPAVQMQVPPGGFVPQFDEPDQDEFRDAIARATTSATTAATTVTRPARAPVHPTDRSAPPRD